MTATTTGSDEVAAGDEVASAAGGGVALGTDAGAGDGRPWLRVLAVAVAFSSLAVLGVLADRAFRPADESSALRDDFTEERVDGLPTGALAWEAATGRYRTAGGVARVAEANPSGPRTMAVVDLGTTNAEISATGGQLADGWGVVFRYQGPANFWYLEAAPDYAVFNVYRVADGIDERVGPTTLVELRDGMTVDVALRGQEIRVLVDGVEIFRRDDDHAFGATRAGLLAVRQAVADGTWTAFSAAPIDAGPTPAGVVLRPPLGIGPASDDEEPGDASPTDDGDGSAAEPAG